MLQTIEIDRSKVAWAPIIESNTGLLNSQYLALSLPTINDLLLDGGRGGGKTETQLMRFRRLVGMGYGSFWRGVIFDRQYKNLDDLIVKSKRLFFGGDLGECDFLQSNSTLKWVWSTGEELLFRVVSDPDDYWNFHGHEYPFIGWNELTKWANPKLYNRMRSVNRSGFDPIQHTPRIKTKRQQDMFGGEIGDYATLGNFPLPPIPLETVSTTNPYGPGHNWVKAEFIDRAPHGERVVREYKIYNPRSREEEVVTRTQVTLFSTFKDNPYLSPEYIAGILEETDENVLRAWVSGDWDIVAGGAFDDVWRRATHVLPRFKIPAGWRIDRSFDWGSSHPFSVQWWAEANGEEATLPDGSLFCPPKGTLVQFAEIYGAKKVGANEGVKWSARRIALAIKEKEIELMTNGWIERQPKPGPADNQIRNVNDVETETTEVIMAKEGIRWTSSDKAPGSRKIGLELMRTRMEASRKKEGPGIYFMANCVASISTIPVLPRDPDDLDDIDTTAEDHPYDATRYRVLKSSNRYATSIPGTL